MNGEEPLRILQLVHGYPPAVGGVEFAVRDICERLVARHGADVTVFTTDAYTNANYLDGSLPTVPIQEGEVQNGVKVRRFPVVTTWARPLRVLQRGFYDLRLPFNDVLRTLYQGPISPAMRKAAAAFEADVVVAASFPLNHMNYAFQHPGRRVVLIGALHTDDPWGYERPNLLKLVNRAHATVAFTEAERDWLLAKGASAERVRVLGLGIDPDPCVPHPAALRRELGIADGDYLVAYVGQQGGHKGIEVLIEALPALLEAVPDACLVVAGSRTPYSEVLERLGSELPAPARARFRLLSDLSMQQKTDLLAACDVFASPSGHESFGITNLEAWARSRPVVLGDGPAQRSITEPGVSSILVPYRDTAALAAALVRLARDPGLRRRLGEAGRRRLLERFTLDAVADAYYELYREAAAA